LRETVRRLPLEQAVCVAIAVTVLDIAAGSNWSPRVRHVAGPLRWALLGVLCVLAVAYAASRIREGKSRPATAAFALGGAVIGIAFISALWSVEPRVTVQRLVAFATILVTAGALAFAVAGRRAAAERILLGVLAGAVLVAVAGIGILVVNPDNAMQLATTSTPARYRGLGQNPNTVAMLFAVAMPIGVWLAITRRGAWRYAGLASLLLLAGSIVASGSRGALIAGFVGSLAPAIAASRSARVAALAAAGCAAALGVGVAVAQIPNPDPHATGYSSANTTPCTPRDAECSLRLEDEIGRPAGGGYVPTKHRSIFGSSGRGQAWQGALEQGAKRPVAGYGFGTESRVFVDRYYSFEGGVPENSYIGMFLQLGAVGVGVFVALLASLVVAGGRALVPAERQGRVLAATCGAVLLVGLALGLFQSYLYAAGNNATLSVWICAFLLTALAARPRTTS
jgi:hypothetical protein